MAFMGNIKDKANSFYSDALLAMEKNEDLQIVRELLLKTIDSLKLVANSYPELSDKVNCRIRLLLDQCKIIREEKSYLKVYKNLTGCELEEPKSQINEIKNESSYKPKNEKQAFKEKSKAEITEISTQYKFNWDAQPLVSFDEVAGLQDVKDEVFKKVISPLIRPDLYEGYDKKNGGGLLLYGAPGTGKTMIAAAIAKEIGAKFCCIGASDLLTTGIGNTEKAISKLFEEARSFKCSIIFFDEVEALCPAITHAQVARQVRSELLRQMQGLESYSKSSGNILYLIGATNKPWDVDPAFVRPGRFGTRVYVDLPDGEARKYMVSSKLSKIKDTGKVNIDNDIDIDFVVEKTKGFNGADMSYLLDEVQEISIDRTRITGEKLIKNDDFRKSLEKITSSVQTKDIDKLKEWKEANG